MTEFIKGQIISFAETNCPTCGQMMHPPMSALTVNRIWDGERWLLLDSWEGITLAFSELGLTQP